MKRIAAALACALIAAAFTIPDIWWQAQHQWAAIAMTHALNQENGGLGNISSWVIGQLIMTALALVWVWVAGLRFLWRSRRPLWRALAWAYGLLFIFFALTTGAKIYYLAGAYIDLLAAGARPDLLDRFFDERGWRPGRLTAYDLEQEVPNDLASLRCVFDLGVDLNAVQPTFLVSHRRDRRVGRSGNDVKAWWHAVDPIAVGHPHVYF